MLTWLRIENIILVESAQIPFEPGLNILSGETGAGKSAVLQALNLIAGEKGDPKLIRHGTDKSVVEASFELPVTSQAWGLLEQAGLQCDRQEPLVIRREISLQGKSRTFVNHQLASLALLKDLGEHLFEIASQHISHKLVGEPLQRSAVDLWGDLELKLKAFGQSWEREKQLQHQLTHLVQHKAQRLREIEACTREIEEIEAAKIAPGEDEALFQEYTLLATSEERLERINTLLADLTAFPLSRIRSRLSEIARIDGTLQPNVELFEQAKIELDEIVYSLSQYQARLTFDPAQMERLDARLQTLMRLKKKYGATLEDVLNWQKEQKAKLTTLAASDATLETLQTELAALKPQNDLAARALSEKRERAAASLAQKITEELRLLNMPHAEFSIVITPQERTKMGDDRIAFQLKSNNGGKVLGVKDASGGERARLMLALKTLLADKGAAGVLIFDEVDANIGGQTARLLGERLKRLGENTQIIAITHFPQVAAQAHHHLRVQKVERDGKICSLIAPLSAQERQGELERMVGASS